MRKRNEAAYRDGREAFQKGVHPKYNPYAGLNGLWLDWQNGWNDELAAQLSSGARCEMMARLRNQGFSYPEIARLCGIKHARQVWREMERGGVLVRCHQGKQTRRGKTKDKGVEFWTKANTVIALVRNGHSSMEDLCRALGYRSTASAHYLVSELVRLGVLERLGNGSARTLRLSAGWRKANAGELFLVGRVRPDGGLEQY
jgi:hypothetical protein